MNPCNPTEQAARQHYLEQLYLLDGRDNPRHPSHGLYTGLAQQRIANLRTADQAALTGLHTTGGDTPLHQLLAPRMTPSVLNDPLGGVALSGAWCAMVATRLRLAVKKLEPISTDRPDTFATSAVTAVAEWLESEAIRAEHFILKSAEETPDAAPASTQPAGVA